MVRIRIALKAGPLLAPGQTAGSSSTILAIAAGAVATPDLDPVDVDTPKDPLSCPGDNLSPLRH